GYEPRFISLASEINGAMPHQVVELVTRALNDRRRCVRGSRILLLGVAYKPNVSDARESPAMEILQLLRQRGARLSYSDPYVPTVAAGDLLLASQELTPELVRRSDCTIGVTNDRHLDY